MARFFLIAECFRDSLAHILTRYAHEHDLGNTLFPYSRLVKMAPTIDLPELHVFQEADGAQFQLCGFTQDDAERRANQDAWRKKPLTWIGASGVAWPGLHDMNLATWPEPDRDAEQPSNAGTLDPPTEDHLATMVANGITADYPTTARVIALYLRAFCDRHLPYTNMIAEAARRAAQHIAELETALTTQSEEDPPF